MVGAQRLPLVFEFCWLLVQIWPQIVSDPHMPVKNFRANPGTVARLVIDMRHIDSLRNFHGNSPSFHAHRPDRPILRPGVFAEPSHFEKEVSRNNRSDDHPVSVVNVYFWPYFRRPCSFATPLSTPFSAHILDGRCEQVRAIFAAAGTLNLTVESWLEQIVTVDEAQVVSCRLLRGSVAHLRQGGVGEVQHDHFVEPLSVNGRKRSCTCQMLPLGCSERADQSRNLQGSLMLPRTCRRTLPTRSFGLPGNPVPTLAGCLLFPRVHMTRRLLKMSLSCSKNELPNS